MRGEVERQAVMLSVVSPEQRIPTSHPLRRIKAIADAELMRLSPIFDAMYAQRGRPSIPPERLLKGCLLIALYSVRSERQLCEQLAYVQITPIVDKNDYVSPMTNEQAINMAFEKLLAAGPEDIEKAEGIGPILANGCARGSRRAAPMRCPTTSCWR